jgi:hypothetical protein
MAHDRDKRVECETLPAMDAGKVLGYGRDATRQAIRDGRLPVIDLNGNGYGLRVSKIVLRRMLGESES